MEDKKGVNSVEEPIKISIVRVRTFFEFESPSLMRTIEEITLFNETADTKFITYYLDKYRSALHIYDSDGRVLEFRSYNIDNVDDPVFDSSCGFSNLIEVIFPEGNPLRKDSYRTIKLEYITRVRPNDLLETELYISLYKNASVYSFIKECEGYEFTVHYSLFDNDGNKLDMKNIKSKRGSSFFEICYKLISIDDGYILVKLKHKMPDSISSWYQIGLLFGLFSSFFIALAYISEPSNINYYFILASITISFLVIIKGWVFQKKMDRDLVLYDLRYRTIVSIIILEVLFMILHCSHTFSFLHDSMLIMSKFLYYYVVILSFILSLIIKLFISSYIP